MTKGRGSLGGTAPAKTNAKAPAAKALPGQHLNEPGQSPWLNIHSAFSISGSTQLRSKNAGLGE